MQSFKGKTMHTDDLIKLNAQYSALNLFSLVTELPILLVEFSYGTDGFKFMIPVESKKHFAKACTKIRKCFPSKGHPRNCDEDIKHRLKQFIASNKNEELNSCHAGLWNQFIKIYDKGKARAVLIFGEMGILDEVYRNETWEKFGQLKNESTISPELFQDLSSSLKNRHKISIDQLNKYKRIVSELQNWYYSNVMNERRIRRDTEKISHELQTRLQPVIAITENTYSIVETADKNEIKRRLDDIMGTALALSTVVQNLGEKYLGGYRFTRSVSIKKLLNEAIRIYGPEADRAYIEIRTDIKDPFYGVELSTNHMQFALNNLVNNAVKYSFRGTRDNRRFVKIEGISYDRHYEISFSNYGIGITAEEIRDEMLFQDGYQGKLTHHEQRTGSGKGLFFVKQVIDKHHGKIFVESKIRSDTQEKEGKPHTNKFTIKLPYLQPDSKL
jgi:signal transduction histidine kinase